MMSTTIMQAIENLLYEASTVLSELGKYTVSGDESLTPAAVIGLVWPHRKIASANKTRHV
jgi:hypothetical protein